MRRVVVTGIGIVSCIGNNKAEVLKSLKKRDKSDKNRKYGPLKKTKDSILINTTKLSRKRCFEKIKAIMDRKLKY